MQQEAASSLKTTPITDDYEICWHRKLGTGINGDVVMAINRGTKAKFALKCLDDNVKSRREISLQLLCGQHPNIVSAVDAYDNTLRRGPQDVGLPRRTLLMVMEYMEGGELFDRIMTKKTFTEVEASAVIRQVATAIKFLHDKNIAHRDLKPENLLYSSKSEFADLKLADFGFAKIDHGNLETPVYTPYYVPGEILEAQRVQRAKRIGALPASVNFHYDKSVDLWSLGVVLYILLCGYPPFQSDVAGSQLSENMKAAIKKGSFVFHQKYWENISEEAKEVVSACLCTEPSKRMTAAQLLEHPWVAGRNVPMTPLMTPGALLGSGEERAAALREMDAELTAMRNVAPTAPVILKPLKGGKNKLAQRRDDVANSAAASVPVSAAVPVAPVGAEAQGAPVTARTLLLDLIDFCLMPPPEFAPAALHARVQQLVAALDPDTFAPVMEVLVTCGWSVERHFDPPAVDLKSLALALQGIHMS